MWRVLCRILVAVDKLGEKEAGRFIKMNNDLELQAQQVLWLRFPLLPWRASVNELSFETYISL